MKEIAVISDIHGNKEALISVLNDIKKRNIKDIICLGDIIAKGTNQQECVKLIRENCDVILSGNCDDYFTSDIDLSEKPVVEQKRIMWNKSKIDEETKTFLKNLPFCYEMNLSGRLVRFFHATSLKSRDFVGNIDTLDKYYELFLPSQNTISDKKADIVVYGHIHTPYIQKIYNRYIINTGSVGNSIDVFRNDNKDGNVKNTSLANYLILKGEPNSTDLNDNFSFELACVSYDIEKELKSNTDNIEFDSYKEEILNGKYRDMKKIYKSFEKRGIDVDLI